MKRRTLIRQFGTGAVATATLVGSAAADRPTVDVDREIDVSDLEGKVPLIDVLDEAELDALDDRIDPRETVFTVGADVESVNPGEDDDECCDITPGCCATCPYWCECCTCVHCW